jgi:hypothetical protein
MDIYARDLVKFGHGSIGTPIIAGTEFPEFPTGNLTGRCGRKGSPHMQTPSRSGVTIKVHSEESISLHNFSDGPL